MIFLRKIGRIRNELRDYFRTEVLKGNVSMTVSK
jgi:hypothetical protein